MTSLAESEKSFDSKPSFHYFQNRVDVVDDGSEAVFVPNVEPKPPEESVNKQSKPEVEEKGGKRRLIRDAVSETGDKMLPEIVGAESWVFVALWVVAYLVLSGLFVNQMAGLTREYFEYNVDTTVSIVKNNEAAFPSVTVCNANPVRKEVLARITKYQSLAALDDYVESTLQSHVEDTDDVVDDDDDVTICDAARNETACPNTGVNLLLFLIKIENQTFFPPLLNCDLKPRQTFFRPANITIVS